MKGCGKLIFGVCDFFLERVVVMERDEEMDGLLMRLIGVILFALGALLIGFGVSYGAMIFFPGIIICLGEYGDKSMERMFDTFVEFLLYPFGWVLNKLYDLIRPYYIHLLIIFALFQIYNYPTILNLIALMIVVILMMYMAYDLSRMKKKMKELKIKWEEEESSEEE